MTAIETTRAIKLTGHIAAIFPPSKTPNEIIAEIKAFAEYLVKAFNVEGEMEIDAIKQDATIVLDVPNWRVKDVAWVLQLYGPAWKVEVEQ